MMNTQLNENTKSEMSPTQNNNPAERNITVRMYDVGFGDCFLLLIPTVNGKKLKVLFDCGTIKKGAHTDSISSIVERVIQDVTDEPGGTPNIDVVVATHRHKDHIIGFDDPAWAKVVVKEVWMPWTEDPNNSKATQFRMDQIRLAENILAKLNLQLNAAPNDPTLQMSVDLAMNAMTNDGAVRTLQQGFSGSPHRRFFPEKINPLPWFSPTVLPDVTVHVLGPSTDEDVINKEMDPPAVKHYLQMSDSDDAQGDEHPYPFRSDWMINLDEYQGAYGSLFERVPEETRNRIHQASQGLESAVAMVLDRAINGTSLVLAFQIGKAMLLFTGDAQWGTWNLAMQNFQSILKSVNFYKMGHHGSYNATPLEFVNNYLKKSDQKVQVMVSVNPTANWPQVPKLDLLNLIEHLDNCTIIRSDQPEKAIAQGFFRVDERVLEARIPY